MFSVLASFQSGVVFFFSSRRRHTRFDCDWSSDVCSSDLVNTMPEPTLRAFQDHGAVALTLERGLEEAERLLERLAEAGIDYDDVVKTLEEIGRASCRERV